jgi:predicted nuclease with TOPRIM domain
LRTPSVTKRRRNKNRVKKDPIMRRKMQNIKAARRYRDKKRAVECNIDEEERELIKKNYELKESLKGVQERLKSIKKSMTQVGLIIHCFDPVI